MMYNNYTRLGKSVEVKAWKTVHAEAFDSEHNLTPRKWKGGMRGCRTVKGIFLYSARTVVPTPNQVRTCHNEGDALAVAFEPAACGVVRLR